MDVKFLNRNVTRCVSVSPTMASRGWLQEKSLNDVLSAAVPNLELQIGLIFLLAQGISFVLRNLGIPGLVAQMLAGLVFNPSLSGKDPNAELFTRESINVIGTAAAFGYQFYVFIHGVKVNMGMLKNVGRKAIWVGILSVMLPYLISAVVARMGEHPEVRNKMPFFPIESLFATTSLPVVICLLNDLKLINSELGRLGLSTAVVCDLFGLFFNVTYNIVLEYELQKMIRSDAEFDGVRNALFILFVVSVVRPILNFLAKRVNQGEAVKKESHVFVIIALFLGFLNISHFFKPFFLYGAFIFGLAVPAGPPFGTEIVDKFEVIANFLIQIYVTTCGMRVDFRYHSYPETRDRDRFKWRVFATLAAYFSKFLVCFLSYFYWKFPTAESVAFALIICAKGAVDLSYYSLLNDGLNISDRWFNFMFAMILILATLIPILVRLLYSPSNRYRGLQKRSVMDSKPDSDLQIVSCIHVPGDVPAAIKLLGPIATPGSPIVVNVVHLIKLHAQSNPVFISHQKANIVLCQYGHSENVIRFFNDFERDNPDTVTVQAMTAISPPSLMYDDVCTVALDKHAAIIILPFHIRWWATDGSVESEDQNIRELNLSILDKSPCSAGILVDRHSNQKMRTAYESKKSSKYNVAMVFLGGDDDREALTIAKRMAQDTRVKLSVVRLTTTRDKHVNGIELTYDNMVLASVKDSGYISYTEEVADDAMATSSILKPMVNEYDLIIVGRAEERDCPQIDGLKEWCEFHELGTIGDLLVSRDFIGSCSVFVVQKQQLF